MKQLYILLLAFVVVAKSYSQSVVKPLVQTAWNQDYPYNSSCPKNIFGNQAVTGCAPTAMAQVMNYWNYPLQGKGSNLYEPFGYLPQYVDFSNASYNWPLPNSITSINSDISKLMYHCGVSMSVQYGTSETFIGGTLSGNFSSVVTALETYFGYSNSSMRVVKKLGNVADWITLLKNELNAGHPIIYSGSGSSGGHVWICDGYNNNNEFHMNFGWIYSESNIFYSINNLNNVSTISSDKIIDSYDFSNNQEAIIGIQPIYNTPDLVINDQSVTNYNPVAGNTITAFCTEKNYGSVASTTTNVSAILLPVSYSDYFKVSANVRKENVLNTLLVSSLASYTKSEMLSIPISIPSSTPAGTYYLYLVADVNNDINEGGYENNNAVPVVLNITSTSGTCSPPSNDNANGAITLTENASFATSGTTCGANGDPTFTVCTADDDVFYKFIATTSTVTIKVSPTNGSDYNPAFQLLSGSSLNNLQSVSPSCINNNGSGQTETQTYSNLVSGDTYYIRVWHNGTGYGTYGNFNILVTGTSCITPGAPYNLSPGTTSTTGQTITTATPTLTWAIPAGATKYEVNIRQSPYTGPLTHTATCIGTNSYTVPFGILSNGATYRWDVTAMASCGSSCIKTSSNSYFTINTGTTCSEPATQSSNINFTGTNSNSITVNWTVGSGERHVVKINTTNSFTNITNGTTTATANTTYQGGEQVVYDGGSNYVTVSGLSPNTTYYFKVYDANCSGSMSMYKNTTATNNPNSVTTSSATPTCTAPVTQASNVTFSSVGTNSMTVNWTNGNGSKRVVKMNMLSQNQGNFANPVNGTDPAYSNYWNNNGEQVIYNGTGNSIVVSNLSQSTYYCFKVFEANCSGNNIIYNTTATLNNQSCQITRQTCTPPTVIPTPEVGKTTCTQPYPYALNYNTSGYNLYWSDNYWSPYYDIEIYEYPYNSSNKVYSQSCINNHNTTVPSSYLQPGKLYCWRVRMSEFDCSCYGNWSAMYYFGIIPQTSNENDMVVCNGQGITVTTPQVTVPSGANVEYVWYKLWTINNERADIKVGAGSSYYVSTTGTYYVRLVYSGSTVCTGNDTTMLSFPHTVKIGTTPTAPVVSSNSPICEGNRLTLTATPPDNTNTYVYYWSGPNDFSSNNHSISLDAVNPANAGAYNCYLVGSYYNQDIGGCPGPASSVNVVINPAPVASYTYTVSGNTVTFTNTSANATTYSWDFGDGQTSTQQNTTHVFATNGTYTICLTVNNGNGCNPSSYCQSITIGTTQQITTMPTFVKVFNDVAIPNTNWNPSDFVHSTIDSSFIFFGSYLNQSFLIRYFKISKAGNLVWSRVFQSNSSQSPNKIIQSKNGYLLSFYYGSAAANIMEIDESGNTLWAKQVNNAGSITGMIKLSHGYILNCNSSHGIDILKIDFSGNIIWKKQLIYNVYTDVWGNNSTSVFLQNLVQDTNGNIYLVGEVHNSVFPQYPSYDGLIIKLDNSGNQIWTKTISTNANVQDQITNVLIDNSGDLICRFYSADSK